MQAILTKYHGPTNTRSSYMTAQADAGKIRVPYSHNLDVQENHARAAEEAKKKFGWIEEKHGVMMGGCLPNGDYAWVFASSLSPRAK